MEMLACTDEVADFKKKVRAAQDKKAVDPRLGYHMGSAFLTGLPRQMFVTPAPIRTVGLFLFNLRGGCTLAQSPLITRPSASGRTREREYMGKVGYEEDWENLCAGLRGQKATITESIAKALSGVNTAGVMSRELYVKFCAVGLVDPATANKNYNEAMATMAGEEDDDTEMEPVRSPGVKRKKPAVKDY